MKNLSQKLSSLTFTAWTLVVLLLWFIWGILLARFESYQDGFRLMNSILIREWLVTDKDGSLLLEFWFVGLCLVMVVLGINLVFCSWNRIFKLIRVKFSGPRLFMLIVHVIFGLVAVGHFGGFMLGYKHDQIRLQEGEQFQFNDGYSTKLINIHFVDDYAILTKSRRQLKPGDFHYRENFANVVLSQNGEDIQRGTIYMSKPMRHQDIQITLRMFTPPRSEDNGNAGDGKPGVMLSISRNPVLEFFLFLYPIMIFGIAIHLIMTWRRPARNPEEVEGEIFDLREGQIR